nr:phage integrase SAM-like domain-containing protein [Gemmatimonadota bacterium]
MPRKRSSRIYLKRGRFYADFRDYADVGGSKEALVALGSRFATQDRAEAERLANAQLQRYERLSKAVGHVKGARDLRRFGAYIEHHLALKAAASPATNQWLESVEVHLDTAKAFFGAGILLDKISVSLVSDYVIHLATLPNGRLLTNGKGVAMLSPSTQRKYLNSLSNLFRRAISEGFLPPGANPVTALLDKPTGEPEEADWLEADEAALVLYAARIYRPMREDLALRCVYALVATLLLTGGRLAEVLGLEIGDVNFQRETITF